MLDTRFIEKFEENVRLYPDKVILRDQDTSLTFRELDELSGRVYAYLKEKGIGKEDFVMIYLPRSVKIYIAMLGIWKAGAAMVAFEDDVPVERIDYVYNDCNCKIKLSIDNWERIISSPSLNGHKPTDIHDAAFAVYTSGSEGFPKGILHEYGKLEDTAESLLLSGLNEFDINERFAFPLPIYATAILMLNITFIYKGIYTHILPAKSGGEVLHNLIEDDNISIAGVVPSMIMNQKHFPKSLKYIVTGSEMSSNMYSPTISIVDCYGQSETAIIPLSFVVDKPYKNTPIGKPTGISKVMLIDEETGKEADDNSGEICYTYRYTRGYINDSFRTAEVFQDGVYHSGDIASINEDGNYVILGRKTDMIKINGNRIEPAEIEAAVKRVLGIDWAFAKGFVGPDRSFICVYYTADIDIDYAQTREQLLQILPTYMIPSYFIHVDDIPRLPNGKVDRQAFKAPDVTEFVAEYVAPTNPLEQRLCTAMQSVLGLERVGIDDDFYLLGGDSLRTIRLVGECNVPGLNVSDIYAARTPRAIAECWLLRQM